MVPCPPTEEARDAARPSVSQPDRRPPARNDELLSLIEGADSLDEALDALPPFEERDLAGFLASKLAERGLRRVDVIRAAGLNETFGYQIFSGQRHASRDKVLALGFALGLDVCELRLLLNHAGAADLCARNRRDAILLFCAVHGLTRDECDAELFRLGEECMVGR